MKVDFPLLCGRLKACLYAAFETHHKAQDCGSTNTLLYRENLEQMFETSHLLPIIELHSWFNQCVAVWCKRASATNICRMHASLTLQPPLSCYSKDGKVPAPDHRRCSDCKEYEDALNSQSADDAADCAPGGLRISSRWRRRNFHIL